MQNTQLLRTWHSHSSHTVGALTWPTTPPSHPPFPSGCPTTQQSLELDAQPLACSLCRKRMFLAKRPPGQKGAQEDMEPGRTGFKLPSKDHFEGGEM